MSQSTLKGTPVSPGFAAGPARVHSTTGALPVRRLMPEQADEEVARFDAAIIRSEDQIRRDIKFAQDHVGDHNARILESHLAFIGDVDIRDRTRKNIREQQIDAVSALDRALSQFAKPYEKLMPATHMDLLNEVRSAWLIVINTLRGCEAGDESNPTIFVTEELTSNFASLIAKGAVAAVVAESGGRYSHGAILARSFGVPAVVGVRELMRRVREGMRIAVNGDEGIVYIEPNDEESAAIEKRRANWHERRRELQTLATLPAATRDGSRVSVNANVDNMRDLEGFDLRTIDGIGLYRTEYLFIDSNAILSEDDQYHQYRRVVEKMKGKTVVFRTVDAGGDKPLPLLQTPQEANPALGWRGVRISLEMPDLFIPQLRALLRAGAHGDARILLPMVTSVEELRAVRSMIASISSLLKQEGTPFRENIPLGAMIEIPAAAYSMDAICEVADFVSIGTNDLVQYLLGVDRDNTRVGSLYDPYHPGVLRTIGHIVSRANANHREVSLCGELASDPQTTALLLGMGLRSLSMTPVAIAQIKAAVRNVTVSDAEALAQEAIHARTSTEAREHVARFEARRALSDSNLQKDAIQK
jgi:phosphotransferase system enzyme I (PtsI)